MKRVILVLSFLLLLVSFSLAEESGEPLLTQAIALGARIGELAGSELYISAFSASDSINEVISRWAEGDYTAPVAAMRTTLDTDSALSIASLLTAQQVDADGEGNPTDSVSDTVREELARRLLNALPTMLNGSAGTETIAAASIMSIQTAFLCEACDTPALYILTYEGGMPVAVTFQPCQDGVVTAQACFLALQGDASGSGLALQSALSMLNLMGIGPLEEIPLK